MEVLSGKISESKIKNYRTLKGLLRDNKFEHVGSGSYASCFGNKKSNYVIKVFQKGNDLAYWAYLKRIRKSKNPYVPKIHSVIEKRIGGRDYIIVILEKLISWEDLPKEPLRETLDKHFGFEDIYSCFNKLHEDYFALNNKIKSLFKLLNNICDKYGFSFDNHKFNIMYRKNGADYFPVFIDPLFNGN